MLFLNCMIIALIILSASIAVSEEQSICTGGGCSNLTIYLGPRWGSKTVLFPDHMNFKAPVEQDSAKVMNRSYKMPGDSVLVEHRPVPDDNRFTIDYNLTDTHKKVPNSDTRTNSSLQINVNDLYEDGSLNLTNMGIHGDEVKGILSALDEEKKLHLQNLYLNHNPLGSLDDEELFHQFSLLTNLKVLGLSSTLLQGLAPMDLKSLEVLDLSNNFLTHLPAIIFNLPTLHKLDLSGNQLTWLFDIFSNLDNLRILSLADNDMSLMSSYALKDLRLDELYMNNNRFHMLYQIMLNPATSANVKLYLSGNPLECDCYLQEELLSPGWPTIADWDLLWCKIHAKHSKMQRLSEFAQECHSAVGWLKVLPDHLDHIWNKMHFELRRLGISSPEDFIIVSVFMFSILLFWLAVCRWSCVRGKTQSTANSTVPYTILDNKQVPYV